MHVNSNNKANRTAVSQTALVPERKPLSFSPESPSSVTPPCLRMGRASLQVPPCLRMGQGIPSSVSHFMGVPQKDTYVPDKKTCKTVSSGHKYPQLGLLRKWSKPGQSMTIYQIPAVCSSRECHAGLVYMWGTQRGRDFPSSFTPRLITVK